MFYRDILNRLCERNIVVHMDFRYIYIYTESLISFDRWGLVAHVFDEIYSRNIIEPYRW